MAAFAEKLGFTVLLIGLVMQVAFALLTDGEASFANIFESEDIGDIGSSIFDFLLGFLQQSWASGFHPLVQFLIAAIFNLAILLLVSGSTALTITAIVLAIVAFIEELIPG